MTNVFGNLDSFLNGENKEEPKKEEETETSGGGSSGAISSVLPPPEDISTTRPFAETFRNNTPSMSERPTPLVSSDGRLLNIERPKESVFWVETVKIKPNPEQPRTTFDEEKIQALAESIRQYGILQPIVVSKREIDVPTGTQVEYQIIAGERRYRAAQMIGLVHIPAIIRREDSDRIKLELALIENLQREDLQPLEKAHAYKRLVKEFGLTATEVGLRVGKSRESVANTMRLLMLPEYLQNALTAGHVTEGQARPLISLAHSPEDQRLLFERVVREGLGVREVEQAARQVAVKVGLAVRSPRKVDKDTHDATTRLYETKLADVLGTRVSVKRTHDGKGKISIEFFSNEELQNLLGRIAAFQEEERGASNAVHPAEDRSTVVLHPPTNPDSVLGAAGLQQPEGVARPEDISTFTV